MCCGDEYDTKNPVLRKRLKSYYKKLYAIYQKKKKKNWDN
jgi:hypothetical protein